MKIVYGNIYVHKSNMGELQNADAVLVGNAMGKLPSNTTWNMLKINKEKDMVTFMNYSHFFSDPHPKLAEYTNVRLPNGAVRHTETKNNPMILHRKETFVSKTHHCYRTFGSLTTQEEFAGLYEKGTLGKIGRSEFWNALLRQKGLKIDNHTLYRQGVPVGEPASLMAARTAMHRSAPSIPARIAATMCESKKILDWGCGRGADVKYYRELGFDACGYDPCHDSEPIPEFGAYPFISCTFVLNVLPKNERMGCIRAVYRMLPPCGRALFSARPEKEIARESVKGKWKLFKDGWVTAKNTFQIGFEPEELAATVGLVFDEAVVVKNAPVVVLATKV